MTYNLADLFERVVRQVPEREAVVSGARRLSYAELNDRADRVAAALASDGVGPGDRIAICLRNDIEYLELMLAAFKLTAVPVNVNYRYQPNELEHVLADSEATLVVHEPELAASIEEIRPQLPRLIRTVNKGTEYETWATSGGQVPHVKRSSDDHYVLYTGGTTGDPKGVVWRQEDIFFAAMGGGRRGGDPIERPDQLVERLADPPNRVLPASPLMHGTAHWFAFLTLFAGSSVVLSPDPTFDAGRLLDLADTEAVSYLVVVGDAFAAPLIEAITAEPDRWDLSHLTVVLSGGATLSSPTRRSLVELLPWVVVVDSYGTSETGGQGSLVHTAGMRPTEGPPRFEIYEHTTVLGDDLKPVVPGSGAVGRVARRGHIPVGYHNDPVRTAATFITIDGERWALTGDQATVADDGSLILLGRGSATINSGGEKVHPEEVEAVLREHPAVRDAVVVGVPDPRWGERVGAVVAVRPSLSITATDLARHCRSHLADFKTPRTMALVDQLRRSESGKPDYGWALEQLMTPPEDPQVRDEWGGPDGRP